MEVIKTDEPGHAEAIQSSGVFSSDRVMVKFLFLVCISISSGYYAYFYLYGNNSDDIRIAFKYLLIYGISGIIMQWMKPISLYLSIVNSFSNGIVFGMLLGFVDSVYPQLSLVILSTWVAALVVVVAGTYIISSISWLLALLLSGWLNIIFILSIAAKWGFELIFSGSVIGSIAVVVLSITNASIALADILFPSKYLKKEDEWVSASFLLLCVSSVLLQIIKYFTPDD